MLDREYERHSRAVVDETEVVARLMEHRNGTANLMLDVGAHIGTSAAYFDRLGWRIICFEPDPQNRFSLVKRFGANPNVLIDVRAVSDKPQQAATFFKSSESTGISGLHAFRSTHSEAGTVEVTTVGEILDRYKVSRIAFLKIDVEGFDFSVLRGVPWGEVEPEVIEAEFEDAKTRKMGHTWKELCVYLAQRGYSVYVSEWHPIVRYGVRHDWRRVFRFGDAEPDGDGWGNLLAFKNDPGLQAVREAFQACVNTMDIGNDHHAQHGVKVDTVAENAERHQPYLFEGGDTRSVRLIDRIYTATEKQPVLRNVGGFLRWILRTSRRYPATLFLLLVLAAGATAGAVLAQNPMHQLILGAGGGLLGFFIMQAAGIGYLLHRVKRHQLALAEQNDELSARFQYAAGAAEELVAWKNEFSQEFNRFKNDTSKSETNDAQIGAIEARIAMLGAWIEGVENNFTSEREEFEVRLAQQERRSGRFEAAESSIHALEAKLAAFRDEAAESERVLHKLDQDRTSLLRDEFKTDISALNKLDQDRTNSLRDELRAAISKTESELLAIAAESERVLNKLDQDRTNSLRDEFKTDMSKAEADFQGRFGAFDERLSECRSEVARINQEIGSLEELQDQADDTKQRLNRLWSIIPPTNAASFQQFNRTLKPTDAAELAGKWSRELSVSTSQKALAYAADRACEIETRLRGRFATSVETLLLRTMLAQSVKRKSIRILEIGCLFGIAAAFMYDQLKRHFDDVHITVLDPLDGYYSSSSRDLLTGEPVDLAALEENFAAVGLKPENYAIIQNISTEDEALDQAQKLGPFDVIILDGDHSYSGVKADFDNYRAFLRRGGLMIFDDYGVDEWPDIARFVDEKVGPDNRFAKVGSGFRTAAFRLVTTPATVRRRKSTSTDLASPQRSAARKASGAGKSTKPRA